MPDSPFSLQGDRSIRASLNAAAAQLAAVSPTARLDAELLMAHALGTSRDRMLLDGLDRETPDQFATLLVRRLAHEPVAYITGERDFWTITLHVAPGVLIPRPDSETLIEVAVDHFRDSPPGRILDLGTGSGALLLAALSQWPEAHGLGVDASERALDIAELNAHDLELEERARFKIGNWAEGLDGQFDLILCNPPYVETDAALPREVADFEPASALFAGTEGLDDYRRLAPQIARLLAPSGCACFEIGKNQATSAGALFEAQGLSVAVRADLAGHDRCLIIKQK
jgi:release factor glutamine methyltransferase